MYQLPISLVRLLNKVSLYDFCLSLTQTYIYFSGYNTYQIFQGFCYCFTCSATFKEQSMLVVLHNLWLSLL